MTSLYTVATDVSPTNNSHRIPQCFDSKLDNKTGSLINFDAKDGGIPINFGLNCLGWMVSLKLSSVLLYSINCFFFWFLVIFGLFDNNDNRQANGSRADPLVPAV